MEVAIVILALIAFVGFRLWLKHQHRMMIHRERLSAIEKGVALPPLDQEVRRDNWNVQRILLLAGLIWISVGIGLFVAPFYQLAHGYDGRVPEEVRWFGFVPALIGVSHLIVYWVGKKREN